MNPRWKQAAVPFLAGCLAGALAGSHFQKRAFHRFWEHGPESQRVLQKFSRELGLDPKQQEAVKAVLERHREKTMALHKESGAKFEAIRLSLRTDIEPLLNPEQRAKFEAMIVRWDARRKPPDGPPGPPPPP